MEIPPKLELASNFSGLQLMSDKLSQSNRKALAPRSYNGNPVAGYLLRGRLHGFPLIKSQRCD